MLSCAVLWWICSAAPVGTISSAEMDAAGWHRHRVESPFQSGTTELRVLVPASIPEGTTLPVVYVLPVEAGREQRYGDPVTAIQDLEPELRQQAIFVTMTFAQLPWYADHPSDASVRQESYLLHTIIPFVEATYPVQADVKSRLLVGYSKSGWGAWSLLLRHPEKFGAAAAWDAPLLMTAPGKYGSGPIFGDQPTFDRYCVTRLIPERAKDLQTTARLILLGYGNFRSEHVGLHEQLLQQQIPHVYRDGPERAHTWHSGWFPEAVGEVLATRKDSSRGQ